MTYNYRGFEITVRKSTYNFYTLDEYGNTVRKVESWETESEDEYQAWQEELREAILCDTFDGILEMVNEYWDSKE